MFIEVTEISNNDHRTIFLNLARVVKFAPYNSAQNAAHSEAHVDNVGTRILLNETLSEIREKIKLNELCR